MRELAQRPASNPKVVNLEGAKSSLFSPKTFMYGDARGKIKAYTFRKSVDFTLSLGKEFFNY